MDTPCSFGDARRPMFFEVLAVRLWMIRTVPPCRPAFLHLRVSYNGYIGLITIKNDQWDQWGFVTILLWWFSFYPLSTSPHYNTCKRTNNMQKQTCHFFWSYQVFVACGPADHLATNFHFRPWCHCAECTALGPLIVAPKLCASRQPKAWSSHGSFQLSWERHREIYLLTLPAPSNEVVACFGYRWCWCLGSIADTNQ